jgi:hypothetical protein
MKYKQKRSKKSNVFSSKFGSNVFDFLILFFTYISFQQYCCYVILTQQQQQQR